MKNKGKLEFDQAQRWDYYEFFNGNIPALVARIDGVPVGICGVLRKNREWWGFFELRGRNTTEQNLEIIMMIRRWLKAHNIDVFVHCEEYKHPTAPKFLTALGFKPTDRTDMGMEVWQWHSSHLS